MRSVVVKAVAKLVTCRRSIIALTGITACVIITVLTNIDTSGSIAMIVTAVAGANAAQGIMQKKEHPNEST